MLVDKDRAARYKAYFLSFRGEDLMVLEEPFLANALSISQFVDTLAFCTDKKTLLTGGSPFQGLGDGVKIRSFGLLLYLKFTLQDYHQQCLSGGAFAEGEEETLQAFIKNIDSIYLSPSIHPINKFEAFVSLAFRWLTEGVINNPNLDLAKTTLVSFLMVLICMDSRLGKLSIAEKVTLSAVFLGQKAPKLSIEALLAETTTKLVELETLRTPLDLLDSDEPPTTTQLLSVDDYFDAMALKCLTGEASLSEKLESVKTELTRVRSVLTALMHEKTKEETLQTHIKHALHVLHVIDANNSKLISKQNLKTVINRNRDSVEFLIAHASASEQREWTLRLEELDSDNLSQQAVDLGWSVLSWVTFIPAALIKSITPRKIQNWVAEHTPSTAESETQSKLRELAIQKLHTLQNTLASALGKKARIVHPLAEDNPVIKTLLLQSTAQQLQTLLDKNAAQHQVFVDCENFSTIIIQNQRKLRVIQGLNSQIDHFIQVNNSFFVQLSIYISNLCALFSIFRSDMASKVSEVQKIKGQLDVLRGRYESAVSTNLDAISQHATANVKKHVIELIPKETKVKTQPLIKDSLKAFNLVKTTFSQLTAPPVGANNLSLFDMNMAL